MPAKGETARKFINSELNESTPTRRQKRVWALAATGIGLDGYDLFIMGAALPLIQADFGTATSGWLTGLLAGAAVLGAVPGALLSGVLSDRFGRRRVLRLDVALFALTSILCAIAWNPASLIGFRVLQGFAIGAEYPISASIIAEVMPRKNRGKWMTGAFSFQAVGMFGAAVVSTLLLLLVNSDTAWRWMLLSCAAPAALIAIMRRSIPESPRWLARNDRVDEAEQSLEWLLGPEAAARVRTRIEPAIAQREAKTNRGSIRELFTTPFRRRTALTAIPWLIMDVALYGIGLFTPMILATLFWQFQSPSTPAQNAFLASDVKATASAALADAFLVIGFILNIMTVDWLGRIRLQVVGFVGMAIGLAVVAFAGDAGVGGVAVILGFIIFNFTVNLGPNATTYLLPVEVFPTRLRGTGHGFAAACGKVGATLGVFLLVPATHEFGLSPTMILIGIMCLVGAMTTLSLRVETRGIALE